MPAGLLRILSALLIVASYATRAETNVYVGFVDISYEPHQFYTNGELGGPDFEITQEAFLRLPDYKLVAETVPATRLYQDLANGDVDTEVDFDTPENRVISHIPEHPQHHSEYRIVTLKSLDLKRNTFEDLYSLKLGVILGTESGGKIQKAIDEGKIEAIFNVDYEKQVKMLLSGRVDAIYTNTAITTYYRKKLGIPNKFKVIPLEIIPLRSFHVLVSRKTKNLDAKPFIKELNEVMSEMKTDGTWLKILQTHYGPGASIESI